MGKPADRLVQAAGSLPWIVIGGPLALVLVWVDWVERWEALGVAGVYVLLDLRDLSARRGKHRLAMGIALASPLLLAAYVWTLLGRSQ